MPSAPSSRTALPVLICVLLLLGCGGDGSSAESDWTIQKGALSLERTLLVSEGESFYFGTTTDVAPASDGRIYVADADAGHVKVLSAEGKFLNTLGRRGKGPGEFKQLNELVLSRGDSLYVLDEQNRRVSVFSPAGKVTYSFSADPGRGVPEDLLVPEDRSNFVLAHVMVPWSDSSKAGTFVVPRVDRSGTVIDTLFTAERKPMYGTRREGIQLFIPIPFAPAPHVAMGPEGHVLLARGDSLAVQRYGLDGERWREVSIPSDPVPVTNEDKERVLKNYSEQRPMPRSKIPSTKPAFTDFLVDDAGRYWFGRPTANPDSTDWWVAWPEEQRVVTTTLPSEVELAVVKNGHAYGQTTTENGAPALVRYRIRIDN